MESQVEQLFNSLAYELDVRNHIRVRMARWPYDAKRLRATSREKAVRTVRFPETRLENEVAVLFGFAGSAVENPPLSYLSYYQVLESFFPAAAEKSALRSIELELADPAFNRQLDRHLLRILQIGKGTANASELAQLQTLIEEYVRQDKLRDFFRANDWGSHFSSKGPIEGCENISADEKNTNFTRQVTERVYKIRNRIVHAKDDPRFANVPPLLPQSDEAAALGPDIELVRQLACEVILSSQTRR
ncbi:methylamine utilization protein MauJ [Streptomyces massasporeus]|uniref:methylamine utilization protein MauJ n=2 Tax=Streptomyces massasporeus TaxID=67324 RepID=UPI0036ECB201